MHKSNPSAIRGGLLGVWYLLAACGCVIPFALKPLDRLSRQCAVNATYHTTVCLLDDYHYCKLVSQSNTPCYADNAA